MTKELSKKKTHKLIIANDKDIQLFREWLLINAETLKERIRNALKNGITISFKWGE